MRFWEDVDIYSEPEEAAINELSLDDTIERLNALASVLPKFNRYELKPPVISTVENIKELDLNQAFVDQKADIYFVNSILINFEVYLNMLVKMDSLDNEWLSKYKNDVEKLNVLENRLSK
ncbi:hypothetical protein R1T29_07960 [Vibrio parahaemolyticus]|uniref:hypothetical protein n=1 Tax=Vibrio parahaemolyticus TaxID=670 RepID=UPI00295387BC|nr:hypothetical protein [Vibrio parahaemolyticus]WOO29115.1 hypothetical protein R1T29_07960 [Vibrio parahaemolyticus]